MRDKAIAALSKGLLAQETHAGCWNNTRKACKTRAVGRVVYKLFKSSANIPITAAKRMKAQAQLHKNIHTESDEMFQERKGKHYR